METGQATKEKRSALQKVSTILGVVLCVIFIPMIIINVIMIVRSYTDPDHMPSVLGISPVIVMSGSMSPEFETGDLIFVQRTDPYTLKVDDVICYLEDESAVTHRIIEVTEEGGQPMYITKGDANNVEDVVPVTPEQIEGKYTGVHLAGVGDFAIFLQSVPGMILFIGGPILLFILWDVIRSVVERRKNKGTEDKLRQEQAAMAEELERLRAQVKTDGQGDTAPPDGQ